MDVEVQNTPTGMLDAVLLAYERVKQSVCHARLGDLVRPDCHPPADDCPFV